jgi:hypothetical protein
MTTRHRISLTATVVLVLAAPVATSAAADSPEIRGEPKNQLPFTRPVEPALVSPEIRGEPKNEPPFTRPVELAPVVVRSGGGFDWTSGGLGALGAGGAALAGYGLVLARRRAAPRAESRPALGGGE